MRFSAALMLAALWSSAVSAGDLAVGNPAPSLTLHGLDGTDIATDSLRGKVVIITFWASWCPPCRLELPTLSEFTKRHASEGLVTMGFSLDTARTQTDAARIASNLNFPVGLLGSAWAGGYGRMWRLPVTFVIDRDGILRHDGWQDDQQPLSAAKLESIVSPLLAAK
jgi:peroxiredoxin